MTELSPKLAVQLALFAYDSIDKKTRLVVPKIIKNEFHFKSENLAEGSSGGFFLRQTTGFLFIGRGHSQTHKGDHVITIRGTDTLADALTDATCTATTGYTGSSVHKGFQTTVASFIDSIDQYMSKPEVLSSKGIIHCVGHSLGGSLATLVADYIKSKYGKIVYLYTFGAPRPGKKDFSIQCGGRIDKVFRCVHGADPVPKVPVWPFCHIVTTEPEYVSYRAQGIDTAAHSLLNSPGYTKTVTATDWDDVYSQVPSSVYQRVVLNYNNRLQTTYSTHWADKIAAALMTVMIDGGFAGIVASLQYSASCVITVYDIMAEAVVKVSSMVGLEEQVRGLLGCMLVFAGKFIEVPLKLTKAFIKWVFNVCINRLLSSARDAMKRIS
ncbi:lipase family protein [Pseudoalteromonas arctica]|uniref:Lipase family protein n=1 Tax=Pseudoalteromonas arctica TaxID=394751 RepID=A0A7Y0DRX0_9GAMM|nr:lipase family protein [Pseudoalteromonas arctica]NMM40436.1 lipase family protein [Pseudoalteromonas arctica]